MARRGRFGQSPRTSPNITNTLISIAREMESQRDQNLMDAWQKGGTFEGRPATDEMVLGHWKLRMKNLDKADPLYNTYKNTITQYTYAIEESKQSTLYAQGKITDGQMAQFYLKWAKHSDIPKDSEFYRVLQRDGAQFMRAAKAKGAAAAKAAAEKAYQESQAATSKKYEATGQYLTDIVTQMAKANALIGMDGNANLTNFDPTDPATMLNILGQVMGNNRGGPNAGDPVAMGNTLFHDPLTGKPITGKDIVAKLKTLDPSFDGNFTPSYFSSMLDRQGQGQAIRLKLADSTGHASDVNNIKQWQEYTSEVGRESKAWPVEKAYQSARASFMDTWGSTTASPESKLAAWATYSSQLGRLAQDPRIVADDAFKTRLNAEIVGDGNVDSLDESFTGLTSANAGQGGGPKDIAETHAWLNLYQQHADEVGKGNAVWTMGSYDDKGAFTPGKGSEIGAASLSDAQNAGPAGAVLVYLPQANGAKPIPVYVPGKPITAEVTDQDGFKVSSTSPNASVVGNAYDMVINGQNVRMYSYKASDGREMFTRDSPWGSGVQVENGAGGLTLHLSVTLPTNAKTGAVDPSQIKDGNPFFTKDAKGNIFVNPGAAVLSSDPARAKAGPDPITDSFSPTIAALLGNGDGQKTLSELSKDPGFSAQLSNEAHANAGAQWDPATASWVPGTGNAGVLSTNQAQAAFLPDAASSIKDIVSSFQGLFGKDTTTATFQGADGPKGDEKLPADMARGTALDALAKVFQPFTNLFAAPSGGATGGIPQINLGKGITVPGVPAIAAPSPTAGPSPTPTPSPTTTPLPAYTVPPTTTPTASTPPPVGGGGGGGHRNMAL